MTSHQKRFEKFFARKDDGCWLWTGARNQYGYGRFFLNGKNHHAHRVAYELFAGPIPAGLVIDHLCRNRCCVNPAHMEPVTIAENTRRGDHWNFGWKRNVTHCPSGHEYTPENTYRRTSSNRVNPFRGCRACRAEYRQQARGAN